MAAERMLVLLRGINVGGRHVVPMAELRTLFADELGCTAVATYIQSGNLVCTAPAGLAAETIAERLGRRFGFSVPVVLRNRVALNAAIEANPFAAEAVDGAGVHAVFLEAPLPPTILKTLAAKCAGDERLVAHGCELFLYLPHGAGRSKLASAVSAPSMPGNPTMRNWKTVLQLQRLQTALPS